jgi:outer membrane immunogenic protein
MTCGVKSGSLLSLVGGAILGALVAAAPSTAADMAPAYKAAAMPAPAYNWSGFYGGVTAGGGMASLPVTDMDSSPVIGSFLNGPALKSGGAVGGLHAGYNWQFAPSFLVGIEGDFNWSSFKASDTSCSGDCAAHINEFASSRLDQFGTVRARFGLTADRTLVFVTAGPAWGHIKSLLTDLNCPTAACATFLGVPAGAATDAAANSSFHVGVALGTGVEYAASQNWIFRAEYMHLDFATKDTTFTDSTGNLIVGVRARSTATADIARLGISYKVW